MAIGRVKLTGQVASFKLEDNTDSGIEGYDATEYGTLSYTSGKWSNALTLAGAGWLYLDNAELCKTLSAKNVYTVVAWFKTTATDWQSIIGASGGADLNDMFKLEMSQTDGITGGLAVVGGISFGREDGTNVDKVYTANAYNDGNWHMALASYDGTTMTLNIDNGPETVTLSS